MLVARACRIKISLYILASHFKWNYITTMETIYPAMFEISINIEISNESCADKSNQYLSNSIQWAYMLMVSDGVTHSILTTLQFTGEIIKDFN